jgi:hypothetical protein
MLPITFFATAFGLMMEKVRSIVMITSNRYSVVVRAYGVYDLARIIMSNKDSAYG